ncbi:MAG: type II toxin-antitoxin system HicA family toxin [Nitrococcus sp.]|nr:type II toxin-antitoxin system HicA family toxin [Nitrococcus sp.]
MALLRGFGYEMSQGGKTGGSRVRFTHATAPAINVHRPYPTPILKRYLIEQVAEALRQEGLP